MYSEMFGYVKLTWYPLYAGSKARRNPFSYNVNSVWTFRAQWCTKSERCRTNRSFPK